MRVCACGCGQPLTGRRANVKYVKRSHGQRAYRQRVERAATASGLPARLSLTTVQTPSGTTNRNGDGRRAVSGRSGRQISYRKAVNEMARVLVAYKVDPYVAGLVAESTMTYCLPERQRGRAT